MRAVDRRTVLRGVGGLLLAGAAGRVWSKPAFAEYPFTLGVASGDPTPEGFVIWTRLAPQPLQLHGGMPARSVSLNWEVAEDERFRRIARAGQVLAHPELAHAAHVDVAGLKSDRLYWYRFFIEGGEPSPVGRVRTAPAAGQLPRRVRLAVAGCQHYESGWYGAWRYLSQEPELAAVFHYGDYIYEGSGIASDPIASGRRHLGDELYSLDDYRRRYAQYKTDPDLQAAHQAAAFIASFDDHEVDNNWGGERAQDDTPPELFELRKLAAMQAWYEHMPVRREQFPRPDGLRMFRRLDYGRLFRLHVLDTRSYRVPGETMLGPAQEGWLYRGLSNDACWNLIAQQVLMMPLLRRAADSGRLVSTYKDHWGGFPESRQRLVRAIGERQLTNVVVASGDSHQYFVGRVPADRDRPDGAAAASEFLGTSISSGGDGMPVLPGSETLLADNPNIALNNAQRGYLTFDVTPSELRADLNVMDRVSSPGGTLSKLARFAVMPDRPGPERC
ncbi:alkaline phosphatase D family protein [Steroidobacter flavus]|uniref:Alkaline phosphatase D family protein n=1 Tax=Steroidobacter flavus TaxID=1842136 RepID=A0ABV8T3F4_9GAMM